MFVVASVLVAVPPTLPGGRGKIAGVGLPTDSRGRVIVRGPNAPSPARILLGTEVVDEENTESARVAGCLIVAGASVVVLLNTFKGLGVMPKIDDSRGAFRALFGAGVAPAVPLTPNFLLI